MKDKKIIGELIENRVIVWNILESRDLFGNGYFGKPLGVPKPKGINFDSPLILDLVESYYLIQKGKLKVISRDKLLSLRDMKEICRKQYDKFDLKYTVFQNLRDRGYVVSPGIKFGCDFAVYEHGPGIDHAPFLVQVLNADELITATNIILSGRLATTVKKQFIIAIPKMKDKSVQFIAFDWWRA
ncbi:MAG TPA: tRNA-intron lyase [Nitrososphaeraceae archaeon]|jgi:tRNA-intron endonuclease|nr:tRNA-intron lyase [Nitrososphaeraceae archaeon]